MKTIRYHLLVFMTLLLLSGITAFPIQTEISILHEHSSVFPLPLQNWIKELHESIHSTPALMFYGTDWLAFAHIVIALFFIPVLIEPRTYRINLQIGMIACLLILPFAFVCGPIRGIPFFHQLIDCSFGIVGVTYLYYIDCKIKQLH